MTIYTSTGKSFLNLRTGYFLPLLAKEGSRIFYYFKIMFRRGGKERY
jgi:hypothetical protein